MMTRTAALETHTHPPVGPVRFQRRVVARVEVAAIVSEPDVEARVGEDKREGLLEMRSGGITMLPEPDQSPRRREQKRRTPKDVTAINCVVEDKREGVTRCDQEEL